MSALSPMTTSWTVFQRTLIYIAAAALSLLALRWLYLFILTDYRPGYRPIIIPLAVVSLILAFGLCRLSSVAVALLLLLAAVVGAGALYIQISATVLSPFLATITGGSILYLYVFFPRITKCA